MLQVRGCTPESVSSKSHITTIIMSSIDSFQLTPRLQICKRYILTSCACPDVSNFKHNGVKIILLNLWWEWQNLVRKYQANLKI